MTSNQSHSTNGVLASMCLSLVLVVASVSALNLALPELSLDLGASMSDLTWIADSYTVALAALVLPIGAFADKYGRRTVLIAGNLVFGCAALAASYADTTTSLIVWRTVMGVGAAMIMPGTLSTITSAFPPERRARGVAIWSGFAAAGAIIGLLVAGALLEAYSWRSIFVVSAAASVIAAVAALRWSPNTRDEEAVGLDHGGAFLSAVAIGTLVFAIIEGNEKGWTEALVLIAIAVCVLTFAGYAFLGLRHHAPLLDPRLFGRRGFRAGTAVILVQFMAVFGFFFVGLQYLQLILDYSPLKAAVALVPVAVVVMPVSQVTPRIAARLGHRVVMPVGLLLLAGGLFLISTLDVDSGYLPFLAGLLISGVGIGLSGATGTSAILSALSARQQGVASAVNDVSREVGSAVGIAVMGSVFGSQYAAALPAAVDALPDEARHAVEEAPAAGLEVAGKLGGAQGAQLADAVQAAFMDGLSASLITVCVVLVVVAAITAFRAPGAGAEEPQT